METPEFKALKVQSAWAGEASDCGVKALAVVCDVEYATALTLLRILGRPFRRGTSWDYTIAAVGMWASG
jgi:hypothetical protein